MESLPDSPPVSAPSQARTAAKRTRRPAPLSSRRVRAPSASSQTVDRRHTAAAAQGVSAPVTASRTRRRRLPARRVRDLIRIGQQWSAAGVPWTVRNIHRKDGLAALEGPGQQPRYVSFRDLGKHYELKEDQPMPWGKIDDRLHSHPKVRHAWDQHPASVGLWLPAFSYCNAYLTDGHVPDTFVNSFLPDPAERQPVVEALLDAGLWEPNGRGWVIHDYLEFNECRVQVLARSRPVASRAGADAPSRGRADARSRAPARPDPSPSPNTPATYVRTED